jgi:mannose/fructose/N-acetylgalactosamine-specific phosphotransferase system component IIB
MTAGLIFRVDDRLLHGSVVIGWGETIPVAEFLLADDEVSRDELVRELCLTCVPPEKKVQVLSIADSVAYLQATSHDEMMMVVIRGCADAVALYQSGIEFDQLNLGGIHFRENSRQLLPYIFLTAEDEKQLLYLREKGVELYCQDLPGNKRYSLEELLHE